jgi:neutral ceramidase
MQTTWKAGVATAVITPAEPMWLAGWAVRTEPARGALTDLYAKALAVEDPHRGRFVLLTADLIGVSREMATAVAEQVEKRCRLSRERLMFCASHTHSGPEIRPDKVPFFHIPAAMAAKIGPYAAWLTSRLAEVVGAAVCDLQPAVLTVRQASAAFAHNRRGTGSVDHDVPILDVAFADSRRRAVVFGYACHNTTMPPTDGRYCGDYAGFAVAALEAGDPGMIALFIAGAGADQDPQPRGTTDLARRHGETLATAVRDSLRSPGRDIAGSLSVAFEETPLEFQPLPTRAELEADRTCDDPPRRSKAEYLLAHLDRPELIAASYPCPLQVARFGDGLLLIALGGEPVINYAHEIKRRHAGTGRVVWVAGYANDMFGYLPTAAVLRAGGYEGARSLLWSALPAPFLEGTERQVLHGVERLVEKLK